MMIDNNGNVVTPNVTNSSGEQLELIKLAEQAGMNLDQFRYEVILLFFSNMNDILIADNVKSRTIALSTSNKYLQCDVSEMSEDEYMALNVTGTIGSKSALN